MKFKFLFAAILSGIMFTVNAKENLNIQVKSTDLAGQQVFLGQYYMSKLYTKDSIMLDKNGRGTFVSKEKYPEGLYVMYFSDSKYFDVLLSDKQQFTIKIDTTDIPKNIVFEGAEETKAFHDYSQFLLQKQINGKAFNERKKQSKDSSEIKSIEAELDLLNIEVKTRQNDLMAQYKGGMLELFLKELVVPEFKETELPAGSKNPDSIKAINRYVFYKQHYFDNVDFSDERTYRTPYIGNTLQLYLDKVLVQSYDSIIPPAINLIERSKGSEKAFQSMCSFMLDYSLKSKIMGMDSLMVTIGRKYYLSGEAKWADSTLLSNLAKEIKKIDKSLVGMKAKNIALCDTLGQYHSIYDMGGSQLTILFFYEPSCGHCKKTSPLLRDFYDKYKDDPRIKVIAVYMLTDQEEWMKFLKEIKMENMTNVWDPHRTSYYWQWYDTSSTPMIYVLDKDYKVFAKKIDVETLEMIAKYELK